MFADRSEGEMTELIDKVAGALVEGYADMEGFAQYRVKDSLLPVLAACIDVLDAEPHKPKRGDEIETWIKRHRDEEFLYEAAWYKFDDLLDDYRLHAGTATPLTSDVDEMGG